MFLDMTPGSTKPLTCPNANEYYQWEGAPTTAQYYVNPAGVPVSDGCRWGSPDKPWGNYAPINLGSGMTDGIIWLSIMQNAPTTNEKLEFNIKIKGDLGGACKYENGMFHDLNGSNNKGCTVSLDHHLMVDLPNPHFAKLNFRSRSTLAKLPTNSIRRRPIISNFAFEI